LRREFETLTDLGRDLAIDTFVGDQQTAYLVDWPVFSIGGADEDHMGTVAILRLVLLGWGQTGV
jgi:hypothetical protein